MPVGTQRARKSGSAHGVLDFVKSLGADPGKMAAELKKLANAQDSHEKAAAVSRTVKKQAEAATADARAAEARADIAKREQERAHDEQKKDILVREAKATQAEDKLGRSRAAAKSDAAETRAEFKQREKELHEHETACDIILAEQTRRDNDLAAREAAVKKTETRIAAIRIAVGAFDGA